MKLKLFAATVAALGLMAPMAQASKSRLGALEVGGAAGTDGSLFIKDTRNIFLNPAYVSQFGGNINLELGTANNTTAEPRAEGGFLMAGEGMSYGVQLGRVGFAQTNILNQNASFDAGQANLTAQNSVEVFFGQGNWGASIVYASSATDNANQDGTAGNDIEQDARTVTLKGGWMQEGMEVFAHIDVINELTSDEGANDDEIEGPLSFRLGGRYDLDENSSVGAIIRMESLEGETGGTDVEWEQTVARVEYFRAVKKEENSMAYYKAGISYSDTSLDNGTETTTGTLAIPLTIGIEHAAKEWLTMRGSVTQNVIIDEQSNDNGSEEQKNENFADTTVAGGVGLTFGELTLDAQLQASLPGTTTAGQVNGNSLLGRVGMNYSF